LIRAIQAESPRWCGISKYQKTECLKYVVIVGFVVSKEQCFDFAVVFVAVFKRGPNTRVSEKCAY
jgi:hypothetical protein